VRQIKFDNYTVDLFVDHAYSPNDSVHKYDHAYFFSKDDYLGSIIGLEIRDDDVLLKSAVIGAEGGAIGIYANSFVYDNDRIVICCSNSIFCLSIPDLALLWRTKADLVTCFEVFKYQNDYIVHGELEISRVKNNGEIIWQQRGADIFTTINSSAEDFVIIDDYILATDWEGRKYKFDFDGNEIGQ
jgi:hypothetical protein